MSVAQASGVYANCAMNIGMLVSSYHSVACHLTPLNTRLSTILRSIRELCIRPAMARAALRIAAQQDQVNRPAATDVRQVESRYRRVRLNAWLARAATDDDRPS